MISRTLRLALTTNGFKVPFLPKVFGAANHSAFIASSLRQHRTFSAAVPVLALKAKTIKAKPTKTKATKTKATKTVTRKPLKKKITKAVEQKKVRLQAKRTKILVAKKQEAKLNSSRAIVTPPSSHRVNGYTMFFSDFMTDLKSQNITLNIQECASRAKEAGAKWKTLSEAEKNSFEERARVLSEKKQKEHLDWWKNVDPAIIKLENKRRANLNSKLAESGKRKLKKLVNPLIPKKPATPFFLYINDMIKSGEKEESVSIIDFVSDLAKRWNLLSEFEKSKYVDLYKAKKAEIANSE
ncbi:hypothetical protein BB559_003446 [Furculomyces boomerangus]|uniref:HMG box domain-containing protein n=2 Tax=Harpellales TaxID=61421 RepID=A0A2T9YL89_9FUNG|nr:hypothetical protein BB559_003446 [Furculomyces boomerangus]PWA03651.1 hypothetical protein BB558_000192 [Smittium angustum]